MSEYNFPQLQLEQNEPHDGIKKLLKKIKPQWNEKDTQIKPMSGGYSSKMFLCSTTNGEPAITVRISGVDNYDKQRGLELKTLEHLSSIGRFPKLYAKYQNGYCYEYITGKPVINSASQSGTITTEQLWHIANEMTFIHSIKVPDVNYDHCTYFEHMKLCIQKSTWTLENHLTPTKIGTLKEFEMVEKYFQTLNSPIVHCHGDTHAGNMIWNKDEKKITFVDWEYTQVGYQYQEVAHFLVNLWICEITNATNKGFVTLPENFEKTFLEHYYNCQSKMNNNFKVETLTQFEELVSKFKLAPFLMFMMFAIIDPINVDNYTGNVNFFLECCIPEYLKLKRKFLCKSEFEK